MRCVSWLEGRPKCFLIYLHNGHTINIRIRARSLLPFKVLLQIGRLNDSRYQTHGSHLWMVHYTRRAEYIEIYYGLQRSHASYTTKTSAAATQRPAIVREFVVVTEAYIVKISTGIFEPSFGPGSP